VVNELTWPDQEYLKTLQKMLSESNKQYKQLFVIHNYQDVESESELLELWRKRVLRNQVGSIQKTTINTNGTEKFFVYYQEPFDTNNITLHCFLAKEGSPAGKIWNEKTISWLLQMVQSRPVTKKKDVKTLLCNSVGDILGKYVKSITNVSLKSKDPDVEQTNTNNQISLENAKEIKEEEWTKRH